MIIQSITAFEMSTSTSQSKVKMPKTSTPVETPSAPATAPAKTSKKVVKAQVVEVPEVVVAAEVVAPVVTADSRLTTLQDTMRTLKQDLTTRLSAVVLELQEVAKAVKREHRESKRRRKVDPATLNPEERAAWELRRSKNAFLKLRPLSDELCAFMGLPSKSQKSQTDVTKYVSTYVKSHSCFDPTFKRRILPDAKLAKLLRVTDKNEVTYLNLQTFLKVHYLKV
jgi:chromatin remodeling complex protein RSC6